MFLEIVVFCWPAGQFPTRICWTENKNMNDTKKDNIDKPTELDRKKDKRENKKKIKEGRSAWTDSLVEIGRSRNHMHTHIFQPDIVSIPYTFPLARQRTGATLGYQKIDMKTTSTKQAFWSLVSDQ